jgi:hypothetical protein
MAFNKELGEIYTKLKLFNIMEMKGCLDYSKNLSSGHMNMEGLFT